MSLIVHLSSEIYLDLNNYLLVFMCPFHGPTNSIKALEEPLLIVTLMTLIIDLSSEIDLDL